MVWRREQVCLCVCLGLCALAGAGCSSTVEDDAPPPAGGSGGAGGTSELMGSGGTGAGGVGGGGAAEPAVPSAAAVSIRLSPLADGVAPARLCNAGTVGSFTYQIGQPTPGHTIESGMQGVVVTCAVEVDSAGSAQLAASISGTDANGDKPMALSVASTITSKDTPADAVVTFTSPDTGPMTNLTGYPACTLGPITVLKSGAILADVDCPLVGSPDDESSGCGAHGTIAFEYCATGRPPTPGGDPPGGQ